MVSTFPLVHVIDEGRVAATVYDCLGNMVTGRHVDEPVGGGHEDEE